VSPAVARCRCGRPIRRTLSGGSADSAKEGPHAIPDPFDRVPPATAGHASFHQGRNLGVDGTDAGMGIGGSGFGHWSGARALITGRPKDYTRGCRRGASFSGPAGILAAPWRALTYSSDSGFSAGWPAGCDSLPRRLLGRPSDGPPPCGNPAGQSGGGAVRKEKYRSLKIVISPVSDCPPSSG
jgi:hypothetical protein